VRIFGNFCWGGNAQRAEVYMVPKNQAAPGTLQGGSIEDAKRAQQTLIQAGMHGKATTAGDSVVEFELPKTEKFLGPPAGERPLSQLPASSLLVGAKPSKGGIVFVIIGLSAVIAVLILVIIWAVVLR
jgi:hypothetical protein